MTIASEIFNDIAQLQMKFNSGTRNRKQYPVPGGIPVVGELFKSPNLFGVSKVKSSVKYHSTRSCFKTKLWYRDFNFTTSQ